MPRITGLPRIRTITTSILYNATVADDVILCNAAGAGFTVNLPSAALSTGKQFTLKKIDTTFNVVTIDPFGAETIDDLATTTLNTEDESIIVVSDGLNWKIQNRTIPSPWIVYTPTIGGFSAVSSVIFEYRRSNAGVDVRGRFNGSGAGSAATVSLPGTLLTAGAGTPILVGTVKTQNTLTADKNMLATSGNNFVNMGVSLSNGNGTDIAGAGDIMSLFFTVAIAGWSY